MILDIFMQINNHLMMTEMITYKLNVWIKAIIILLWINQVMRVKIYKMMITIIIVKLINQQEKVIYVKKLKEINLMIKMTIVKWNNLNINSSNRIIKRVRIQNCIKRNKCCKKPNEIIIIHQLRLIEIINKINNLN
jgi:hypothetical protein